MQTFMKPKNNYYEDYSNYSGLIVIYLLSIAIAATLTVPGEDHWYIGIFKAIIWPLYLISKILT